MSERCIRVRPGTDTNEQESAIPFELWGDAGRHARSAPGQGPSPLNVPIIVDDRGRGVSLVSGTQRGAARRYPRLGCPRTSASDDSSAVLESYDR